MVNFLRNNIWHILILASLVFVAYFNSLNNSFVSDDLMIPQTKYNLKLLFANPYRMIVDAIYLLISHFFGFAPLAYHVTNVIFHLATTILVFVLLSKLTTNTLAFFSAGIFSVHPLLTESVTWVSGGVYIKYSFFFLTSLLFYHLSYKSSKYYFLSVLFFLLCLESSEKAISLFLMYVIYEFSFGNLRKNWKKLLPFVILGIVWSLELVTHIPQRQLDLTQQSYRSVGGLENPLIRTPTAIATYLLLVFWPKDLSFYQSEFLLTYFRYFYLIFITFLYFVCLLIAYKRNRFLFFWLSLFFIALLPTITPLKISWVVAERYAYLSVLGIVVAVSFFLTKIAHYNRKLSYGIFLLLVVGLSFRTVLRNRDWKNVDTLWLATAKTAPSDPKTHMNLGDYYFRHGDLKKAAGEFNIAISLNHDYAEAYHNLGNTFFVANQLREALVNYHKAVGLNRKIWRSYQNIAIIFVRQENFPAALENIQKAIAINDKEADLYNILGYIYLNTKHKPEAERAFLTSLHLNPKNDLAKKGLAEARK